MNDINEIPEKIFLCPGEQGIYNLGPLSWGDVIWADERTAKTDIEYIRYDLYKKMEKELRDQIKYLIAENSIQSDKE